MGFLDKAKQMADQAQQKIEDAQKQFNESQAAKAGQASGSAPATQFDQHGRPVGEAPPAPAAEPSATGAPATSEPAPAPNSRGRGRRTPTPTRSSRSSSDVLRWDPDCDGDAVRRGRRSRRGRVRDARAAPPRARVRRPRGHGHHRRGRHDHRRGGPRPVAPRGRGRARRAARRRRDRRYRQQRHPPHDRADLSAPPSAASTAPWSSLRTTTGRIVVGWRRTSTPSRDASQLPIVAYNIPQRCAVDMPNDLLAELGQHERIVAVKQARTDDTLAPIDGLDLLAGNDDALGRVLDMGGTGGILVASHLVGEEMRRMIDEPERRARDREVAAAALRRARGGARGGLDEGVRCGSSACRRARCACRTSTSPRSRKPGCARRCPSRACCRRSRPERHAAPPAARRVRRDREEHDGRRVRRPDRRRRHRAALPDAGPARSRPRAARTSPTSASARKTSRRSCSRMGTRTTSGRSRSWCASSSGRPPIYGGPLTIAMVRSKLDEHKLKDVEPRRGPSGRQDRRGAVLGRAGQARALDPRHVRLRAHVRARHGARHRRLQVRPDPGRRHPGRRRAPRRDRPRGRAGALPATRRTPTARGGRSRSRPSAPTSRRCSRASEGASSSPASPPTSTASSRWSTPHTTLGRKVSLVGRSMRKNVNIGRQLGHISVPDGMLVEPREVEDFPDEKLVIISTGSQGEPLSALRRMAAGDHPHVDLHSGDTVIFSATPIPGQRARGERDDRPASTTSARTSSPPATRRSTPRATATRRS